MNNFGVQVPTNWKSNINQVVAGYETEPAKGLVHGFQKDAIQNTWGARLNKRGTGWGTKFELIENDIGTFLTIEDWGTTGMTGPNITMEEINKMSGELSPSCKLARFSAMNYSGGNEGAGLFGRGKLLFSAASKDYNYYFETLTKDEGYRANFKTLSGNTLNVNNVAFEDNDARQFIEVYTKLSPINNVGSRIIIVNPIDEIVEAIKNGEFIKNIEETWWRILLKYNVTITVEYSGSLTKANVPENYRHAIAETNGWKIWSKTNYNVPGYHSVKKLQLFVSQTDLDEDLCGVYFYRKDMKIGEVVLEIPHQIQNKYFGFIEVDDEWEKELAINENLEHYGVKNKNKRSYQKIKSEIMNEHRLFMEELGLIKKKRSEDDHLRKELNEISQGLDSFFSTLNMNSIGSKGEKKDAVEVSWAGMEFPSSYQNRLFTGDVIENIKFKVKNNTGSTKKINYKLFVKCHNKEVLSIAEGESRISGSLENIIGPFNLKIDSPLIKYEKNILCLEIIYPSKQISKQIPLYYDLTPLNVPKHNFVVKNSSMEFPNVEKKRVNTNERISNIKYIIENNTSEKAYIAFHLSSHNVIQSNEIIESILLNRNIILNPFCQIEVECPDIIFESSVYETKIERGKIEIRARISAAKDFLDYEMADELSKGSKILINFNQDPDGIGGAFTDFRMLTELNGKRSDIVNEDGNWVFELYINHPTYLNIIEDEYYRKEFITEEMLKQMVRAHIEEGNYSILNFNAEESQSSYEEMTNLELIEKIYTTIDYLQFKRLNS